MEILVRYNVNTRTPKGTHTYKQSVSPTTLFCPACGKQDVWKDDGVGDYYTGPTFYCRSCKRIGHYMMENHVYSTLFDNDPISQIFRAISL